MFGEKPTKDRSSTIPRMNPSDHEIQPFASMIPMPIALADSVRRESADNLNQLLADVLTLRDLYKKHHWQTSGASFYSLHQLFDKHAGELAELSDMIAERVMTLGGVSIAMAADVAEMTRIPRPPRGREAATAQLSRLLHAHEVVLKEARTMAKCASAAGDDGGNDLIVGDVIRLNETQVWFVSAHLVGGPPGRSANPTE